MTAELNSRALQVRQELLPEGAVLGVEGEIDLASAPTMKAAVDTVLEAGKPVLVVDLSGVTFLGSAGLSVLVNGLRALPPGGLRVVASPPVRRAIEVTGLDHQILLRDTVEAALEP